MSRFRKWMEEKKEKLAWKVYMWLLWRTDPTLAMMTEFAKRMEKQGWKRTAPGCYEKRIEK